MKPQIAVSLRNPPQDNKAHTMVGKSKVIRPDKTKAKSANAATKEMSNIDSIYNDSPMLDLTDCNNELALSKNVY